MNRGLEKRHIFPDGQSNPHFLELLKILDVTPLFNPFETFGVFCLTFPFVPGPALGLLAVVLSGPFLRFCAFSRLFFSPRF
jgi:hypothetical protein